MGVERDEFGRPRRYYVESQRRTGDFTQFGPDTQPVPADLMLHGFIQQEPDQARGIPPLACNLETAGHMREFEQFVLDAQKLAASSGIFLTTNHPDAPFISVDASVDLERNTQSTLPPGWQYNQLQPTQPSAQYVDYRKERQLEIGRPNAMPNLTLRADASNHNFSSAHFDSQGYQRANRVLHNRLGCCLKRLVSEVRVEARLAAIAGDMRVPAVLARSPKRVRITFKGWPVQTHVDPSKVRKGNEIGLKTMQLAPSDVWAGDGNEFDKQLKKIEREYKRMATIQITDDLTLLDLFLASIRPPNDPLAETIDEDGDADDDSPKNQKQPDSRGLFAHA
jgi:hypothetical protein